MTGSSSLGLRSRCSTIVSVASSDAATRTSIPSKATGAGCQMVIALPRFTTDVGALASNPSRRISEKFPSDS
ncbi:MAG: hypothetical protein HYV60_06960 [Planctomycetia bacterium]|nr:hypothetical protein [Planctomycetia bacterium]